MAKLTVPSDVKLSIKTSRLSLEPILSDHADEMFPVLSNPELYKFVPQDPPDLESLRNTYNFWSQRISPDKDELWLNWVARKSETKNVIGHFQVGYKPEEASIAYTVGIDYQRRGFATEALKAIFVFLRQSMNCKVVKAWIDTRNTASIDLVKKLDMLQVDVISKADHFKGTDSDEYVFQIFL